jgi:hypothetical protein
MSIRHTTEFSGELAKFASLDREARMAALAIVAHDITVGIRSELSDLPLPAAADRVRALNEYLHQITGRIHASNDHSGDGERELLEDIAKDAEERDLGWVVMRRLGAAVRQASNRRKRAAAVP